MKKVLKITFSILLIILSTALLMLCLLQQQGKLGFKVASPRDIYSDKITVILNCSLPEVLNEVPILEVVRHNYTYAEAEAIARLFNITERLNITKRVWSAGTVELVVVGSNSLSIFDNGAIQVHSMSMKNLYPKLPSSQEAKEIADRFVKKIESYGLASKLVQIKFSRVCFSEYYGVGNETWPVIVSVFYRVEYQGMPLVREGWVEVAIGDEGNIVYFWALWRNVKSGRTIRITVSPEDALEEMSSYINLRDTPKIKTLVVNRVELGYFTPPPQEAVDELLPTYEIECLATFEDGSEEMELIYVPATSS